MIPKIIILLLCSLAPYLAGASALQAYGTLAGKTPLLAPSLPNVGDSIFSDLPADKTKALAQAEDALAKEGIAVVPDGPHFVRLVPVKQRDSLLKQAPLHGHEFKSTADQQVIPAGMLDLLGADVEPVLALYAEWSQRTVLRPAYLPCPGIHLKTECPLSRDEVVYALATVLALNGIALVNDGDRFVQAVPLADRAQLKLQAPTREPNAKLFDPKKVPAVGTVAQTVPASKMERDFERLRTAFYNFINYKGTPPRPAFRLLELDAALASKTALASEKLDGVRIWFHVQTPLTKAELLYAIETTFNLNALAIVPVDHERIRLGFLAEVRKKARKPDAAPHPQP